MKLTLFACLFSISLCAQPYLDGSEVWKQYHYGNVWVGHDLSYTGTYQYTIQGTTVLNGKTYFQIQRTGTDTITEFGSTYEEEVSFHAAYLREEGSQWLVYQDNGGEVVLYDFDLEIGESIDWAPCVGVDEHLVESISTTTINGEERRVYSISGHDFPLIEGVGWTNDLELYGCDDFPTQDNFLLCFEKAGINNLIRPGSEEACGISTTNEAPLDAPGMRLSPNPAASHIQIHDARQRFTTVRLFDLRGKAVLHQQLTQSVHELTVPRGNWPAGLYWLVITDEKGNLQTKRVVWQ